MFLAKSLEFIDRNTTQDKTNFVDLDQIDSETAVQHVKTALKRWWVWSFQNNWNQINSFRNRQDAKLPKPNPQREVRDGYAVIEVS